MNRLKKRKIAEARRPKQTRKPAKPARKVKAKRPKPESVSVRKLARKLRTVHAEVAPPIPEPATNGSEPKKKGPTSCRFNEADHALLAKLKHLWGTDGPTTTIRKALETVVAAEEF